MDKNMYLDLIKEKWKILEAESNIFRYKINILRHKFLEGDYRFYSELNPERSNLRRVPQIIPSLFSQFDSSRFNFNKIKSEEVLLILPFADITVTFIINQSPLTQYHTLICPSLEKCQPQHITKEGLEFCTKFLLDTEAQHFRIGYNSPGALASVNHLHFHLLYIEQDLYIDNTTHKTINNSNAYRLDETMPTEAVCYLITKENITTTLSSVHGLLNFLFSENIPHNIFITPDKQATLEKRLKLFIFAREKYCHIKDLNQLNIAFCEFSGYVPVGSADLFKSLTQESVINKIKEESGEVYHRIYKFLERQ